MFGLKLLGLLVMTFAQPQQTYTGPGTEYVHTSNHDPVNIGSSEPNEPWPRISVWMSPFDIGATEVSIAEYTIFLNSVEAAWGNTLSKVATTDGRFIIGLVPTGAGIADNPSQECINFLTALAEEGFDFDQQGNSDLFELITVRSYAQQPDAAQIVYNASAGMTGGAAFSVDDADAMPVTYVSYFGARMFARYYGMDLPFNTQWDWAASRANGQEYPSGIDPQCGTNSVCDQSGPSVPEIALTSTPDGLDNVLNMHDNVSEWVRDWQPFQNKPNPGEAQDNTLILQFDDGPNNYNNVGHNKPGLNLDVAYHKKTIKGGNYLQTADQLTKNQQCNFDYPNTMAPNIGFRVVDLDSMITYNPIQLTSDIQYNSHSYYQKILCDNRECQIKALACHEECETCDGPNNSDCITCPPGANKVSDSCECDAALGYTWSDGACRTSNGCKGNEYYGTGLAGLGCNPCAFGTIFCDQFGSNGSCNSGSIEVNGACVCDVGYFFVDLWFWCEPIYPYCPVNTDSSSGVCVGVTCVDTCASCSGD